MEIQGENEDNFSVMDLEKSTYRYLQQLAKSLNLPSNVKKVYLIHLIRAKKFKTEEEVNIIIQQVKEERKQLALSRRRNKKHVQNKEISSTCINHSPPITRTPRRSVHAVHRYSPDFHPPLFKYNPKHTNTNIARSVGSSDRVLRSFNLKALRKSYGAFNVCSTQEINAIKVRNQSTSPKQSMVRVVDKSGRLAVANVAAQRVNVRRRQSIWNGSSCLTLQNENLNRCIIAHEDTPKRQRTLSGIYPLAPLEIPYQNFEQIQGVRMRRTDGRLSTINALVHKRNTAQIKPNLPKRKEISIQDLLNTIDTNLNDPDVNTNYTQPYPNMSTQVDVNRNYLPFPETYKENLERYSVYYHKKIRSEQIRCQRVSCKGREEDRLPTITDVFSQFKGEPNRNVTQPLYVHVTDVSDTVPSYTPPPGRNIAGSHMLESLYNFKNVMLTNSPLLQVATTSNTKCVYSTPVIATAMAQQTTTLVPSEPFNLPPCEPDNEYRCSRDIELPRLYESIRHSDPDYSLRYVDSKDLSRTTSPLDTSQSQVDGSATIPEMVEDALEIISQDGDYMEQIGMDIRVQCVLCSWAGPKIILEFHIRKEHPTQVHKCIEEEYRIVYTLGSLLRTSLWVNQVLEHDAELYVLSVKYESPDGLMASLSSLCSDPDPTERHGTITLYNKVSGEPYLWEGYIQAMPPNLPYENDITRLNIPLSKLDLLPNSANLKLHNEELVLKSPTKVVVGQPEFNDIHITLFVRIS